MPSNPLGRKGVPAPQQPWARTVDDRLDAIEIEQRALRTDLVRTLRARLPVGNYTPDFITINPPSTNVYTRYTGDGVLTPTARVTTVTGLLRVTVSCLISMSSGTGGVVGAGVMTYSFGPPLVFDNPADTASPEALTGGYHTVGLDSAGVTYLATVSMTRVHQLAPGTYTVTSEYAARGSGSSVAVSFSQRTLLLEPL